jgi:hypothetical protein
VHVSQQSLESFFPTGAGKTGKERRKKTSPLLLLLLMTWQQQKRRYRLKTSVWI